MNLQSTLPAHHASSASFGESRSVRCACVVSHVCVFACVLVRLLDSVLVSQVPAAGLSEFVSAFMCFLLCVFHLGHACVRVPVFGQM